MEQTGPNNPYPPRFFTHPFAPPPLIQDHPNLPIHTFPLLPSILSSPPTYLSLSFPTYPPSNHVTPLHPILPFHSQDALLQSRLPFSSQLVSPITNSSPQFSPSYSTPCHKPKPRPKSLHNTSILYSFLHISVFTLLQIYRNICTK